MPEGLAEDMEMENFSDPLSELEARTAEVEKLLSQNSVLSAQKAELENTLNEILHSRSWKITAPLRCLTELHRRIFPLFRFSRTSFRLMPGRNTTTDGAHVVVRGPSPYITLEDEGDLSSAHGWIKVDGKLRSGGGHGFFFLHYRTGSGFNENERCPVMFVAGHPVSQPFFLPKGIKEFRLDPFNEGEFDIHDFSLEHLGTLQFLARLFMHHLGSGWKNPRLAFSKLRKFRALLREGGLAAIRVRLFADQMTNNYQEWVKHNDLLDEKDERLIKAHIRSLGQTPMISVIMPVWNTPEQWLRAAIDSVRAQFYTNWELCISDDASSDPRVRKVLEEYQRADSRIKVTFREKNGHISEASNSALALATGDYVAFLDHDDELRPHALYMVVNEISNHPDAGLVYSDEDKKTSHGLRFNPYFKSDWNPVLLLSQNYVCHLTVIRRDLVSKVGGFRKDVEGAQDWDLILRVSREIDASQIRHIPHVLYHWRVIEGSTAQSTSYKPYVLAAQKKAVEDHLSAMGKPCRVEILEAISQLRPTFSLPTNVPLVSLIVLTRDRVDFLKRCVDSILDKSVYPEYEVIIVDNGSRERETLNYLQEVGTNSRVRVIRDDSPFNFSRLNNAAVASARGSILGFLNNDLEVISREWLSELVSYAIQKEIGAVGARLLYPSGLIQHAGIVLGIGGVAGHNHKGQRRENPGYFNRAILPQNFSAVTAACLVVRREVFDQVGGFDETLSVAFNDVDLCLRIEDGGFKNVYTPYSELYHFESVSRGYENTPEKFARFEMEIQQMKKRWGSRLLKDPYYNPNLTLLTEDFTFAFPSRATKPWKNSSLQ